VSKGAEAEGEGDVQHDAQGLELHIVQGAALFAQPREGDAGPDVEEDDGRHQHDVFGMGRIGSPHHTRKRMAEEQREQEEDERRERRDAPRRGEEAPFGRRDVAARLVGLGREAEVARLHAHGQQREHKRDEGVDIRHDAVGLLSEDPRVVRREQVAQKAHHDGADAVDGRLFRQFFEHTRLLRLQRYENSRKSLAAFSFFL